MTKFKNLAAASHGAGLQYYDVQDFIFTKAGVFLPLAGSGGTFYHHSTSQFTLTKNRPGIAIPSQILTSVLLAVNRDGINNNGGPGNYHLMNSAYSDTVIIGSSGGFPIFYAFNISISNDSDELIFTIDVGNPSGVNDVTSESIQIDGRVFFYLAPF